MIRLLPFLMAALVFQASAQTRYHEYTRRFDQPKQPATPLAAGYLGGAGDEYLVGAAFLPDRSLLLAGNAFGPQFSLAGTPVPVIGRDTAAPPFKMPFQPPRRAGEEPRMTPPDWTHAEGAGFVVRLTPDYRRIQSAIRFPWGAGSITDLATDPQGRIFVTGIMGANFPNLAAAQALPRSFEEPDRIFLGQLAPDLRGFVWCVGLNEDKRMPGKLAVLNDGTLSLIAKNAYHFSPEGRALKASQHGLMGGYSRAINPITHALARGRDHNTRTGWEPWRRPVLEIYNEANEHTDTFYQWDAQVVGTNWSRLVSDSDIRLLHYDRNGNLFAVGWSDGGNTVLESVPYDIRTGVNQDIRARTGQSTGLGFSTWGAGVGSFMHIMKMDVGEARVLGKTLFCSYLPSSNRPNSASVEMIHAAADQSILIAGGSANGLIETASLKLNTLSLENEDYMGGPFVSVLNERMTDLRFSSGLPGAGQVSLAPHGGRSAKFAASSREIDGATYVAFVTGAVANGKFRPVHPVQSAFGGGHLDGLYVVLRMDTLALGSPEVVSAPPVIGEGGGGDGKKTAPPAGTFKVSEGMNRHFSILSLRDSTHRRWPLYYLARPLGQGQVDSSGSGRFVVFGPGNAAQLRQGSRQEPRLAGNLVRRVDNANVYPDLEVAVELLSATRARGKVSFNGRTVTLEAPVAISPSRPSGQGIMIGGTFRATKAALGLAGRDPNDQEDQVLIEFWVPGRP